MKSIIDSLLNISAVLGILALIAGETALIVFISLKIPRLFKTEFCSYIPFVSISLSTNGGNTYGGLFSKIPIYRPFYLRYEVSVVAKGLINKNKTADFSILIPDKMCASIHEISAECNLTSIFVSGSLPFSVFVSNKKPGKAIVILKCQCKEESCKRQPYFKLESKNLKEKYSNIRSLEFVDYLGNPV
jgi:hypothetical protein